MYDPTEDPLKDCDAPITGDDWLLFIIVAVVLIVFGVLLWFAS